MNGRTGLKGLMALVLLAGVGLTVLRSGSNLAFQGSYSATLAVLFFAALAAPYRSPFWYGFAFCGWGYFLLGIGPWFSQGQNDRWEKALNHALPTNWAIEQGTVYFLPYPVSPPHSQDHVSEWADHSEKIANTMAIAHLMTTLVIATIGGLGTVYLAGSSDRSRKLREGG